MTAYLEALAHSVPGAAIFFNIGYSCHDFVTQFWVLCHFLASGYERAPMELISCYESIRILGPE